jgi:type I protein arginine methyltransferase
LQTGPTAPATHWYQTRLLLKEPLAVNKGQLVNGYLKMRANREQTFNVSLKVELPVLNVSICSIIFVKITAENEYDMKDPEYRGAY